MLQDFTRINFGWWGYWAPDTQPDMLEYGTSRAAAWDCPVAFMENADAFAKHPRSADNFEVMRRWEDVRAKKWLTKEQKTELQNLKQEHILLINENKDYELAAYDEMPAANKDIRAFVFERKWENYVVYWHASGSGSIELPIGAEDAVLLKELGEEIPIERSEKGAITIPIGDRRYLKTRLMKTQLTEAFGNAKLL